MWKGVPRSEWRAFQVIKRTVETLNERMVEISPLHFYHPNNHLPHFPHCRGQVDTFPVISTRGKKMYQPKYEKYVRKFQITINNMGLAAHLAGPFKGSASDTAIYRENPPEVPPGTYLLADKAYISISGCIPQIKENDARFTTRQRNGFNFLHGHYRSRVERAISWFKKWASVGGHWRSSDMDFLGMCVRVVCNIRNMYLCWRLPYRPYMPSY